MKKIIIIAMLFMLITGCAYQFPMNRAQEQPTTIPQTDSGSGSGVDASWIIFTALITAAVMYDVWLVYEND